MSVGWKYDILFSFNVVHPMAQNGDFQVLPTAGCLTSLNRSGLIFKQLGAISAVLVEKNVKPDGTPFAIPKIQHATGFTFLLFLKNPALWGKTYPFDQESLPAFSGRRRILYFDNLNAAGLIDADLDHPQQTTPSDMDFGVLTLTADTKVGDGDLASVAPGQFELLVGEGVTQVKVEARQPGNQPPKSFPVLNNNRNLTLELEEGGNVITRMGSAQPPENLVAYSHQAGVSPLGIIRIYKDAGIDYDTTIRYDILF